MIEATDLPSIVMGLGIGLLLGLAAVWLHRRRIIGRLGLLLLAPLLVLIPVSWPLAGALSFGGLMEQLRCALVVVIPLSVAVWLLARVAGWDVDNNTEETMFLHDMGLEARQRWAAENILESENLTADLLDAEAKQLLQWGVGHAKHLATRTLELPPAEAQQQLENQLEVLRKLIRGISKLAAEGRPVEDERLRQRLARLLDAAAELGWSPSGAEALDSYVTNRFQLSTAQKVEQLETLLRPASNRD